MTSEFIQLQENLTAEQTINKLRELEPTTETIYYLYIVNEEEQLQGVVSLRDLIVAKPDTCLKDIMATKIIKVTTSAKREKVAELIAKYDLLALPVTDKKGKLVGIVTVDDIMNVLVPPKTRRKGFRG